LALNAAKVLKIITADKSDSWYTSNGVVLQKLIQKGMKCDDHSIHDALHPIFQRLLRLFPLPKEDEERQGSMSEFHTFVYQTIGEGLNQTALRGTLLMLKTVVELAPERIEPFSAPITKLLGKLVKDHLAATAQAIAQATSGAAAAVAVNTPQFENLARLIILMFEICQLSVAFLGESRRPFHASLCALVEGSKTTTLCGYLLDLGRSWALHKHDPYPTIKDKATFLQKMLKFEKRGDGTLFHKYLELIYDIYNEPTLRRSDLTTRLEPAFLVGCRAQEGDLREKFMDLLDASIPRTLFSRLSFILGVQSWEALADHNWIYLALHLLLGTIDAEAALLPDRKITFPAPTLDSPPRLRAHNIVRPMQRLTFLDSQTAHDMWVSVFPAAWACLSRKEQVDVTHHMISILTKQYHIVQATMRPNIIQTLLAGVHGCSPPMILPPHLVKYLAKTYGAWYIAMEILEASWDLVRDDDGVPHDAVSDSLADVYAELAEDDMFYGLWRRRCLHIETNMGIAFEQNGMWEQASSVYEIAQSRTRTGTIPFSEPEYYFWEDHWMLAAEKLQQWDTLYELARNDHNQELMLESAWRIKDWTEAREQLEDQIKVLPDVGTPRRRVFEAFLALLKSPSTSEKGSPFTNTLEDAMQLSLRKWISLPTHLCHAHVPLLQHFQQFVELQEAVGIFASLAATNAQNLEKRSAELKLVLQAWRERLPNFEDDISVWSDLVAWRQNVFSAINKAYIPLITNTGQGSSSNTNTFGYRGYHETAWIINRFAHIARRHELLDVCFTFLNRIYTLPNIEISEAFLKIREQAKCHYQKPNDLQAGLDVIHNTNLMYFSTAQKTDFFTLKAMFLARFGRHDEASSTFSQAIQMDMTLPKAWSEYGKWNDRMFKEHPSDMSYASNAISGYLNAVGLYKSGKCRPLIARILWLLSVDDGSLQISKSFDTYKGDAAFWYWISFIPQLCLSISQREVKQARYILHNLAKLFPQVWLTTICSDPT
jgi:transformation/transcription domain-associated protein